MEEATGEALNEARSPCSPVFPRTFSPTQTANDSQGAQKGATSPQDGGCGPCIWEMPGGRHSS
jgi:hypothetical protein